MPQGTTQLRIRGLTALQLAELKEGLAPAGEHIAAEDVTALPGASHGEPQLLDVIIQLSPAVIAAFAVWLSKQKHRRTERFRYSKVNATGAEEKIELDLSDYGEAGASASAIEALLQRATRAGKSG
jgi:hypothetical protein